MKPTRLVCSLFLVATLAALPSARAQNRPAGSQMPAGAKVDAAFQKFWAAESPKDAERLALAAEKSGVTFDEALRRLKAGRTYAAQRSGVVIMHNRTADGIEHYFAVNVPAAYDPTREYQVRVQLHGGVNGRENNTPQGTGEIGALEGAEQIYVLPYAWAEEPWWNNDQILNLDAILDTIKRMYNVDENHVVLSGTSDGATGALCIAMRDTTPFASFLPLNGFLLVLANDDIDDGFMFPNNLRNKPIFAVNGGKDRLYPSAYVEPVLQHLMDNGVALTYDPQPDGEHNTKWWPDVKDRFEKFVVDHPRDPQPAKLTWQAADSSNNRDHWLIIDTFGTAPGEAQELPDVNVVARSETALFDEIKTPELLFGASHKPGQVDLVRTGNTVQATTKNVTAFTLLLSPDAFDFDQPIKVVANGREVFNARVERKVGTLLKWAARDNDRTMLYAAELKIKLTP